MSWSKAALGDVCEVVSGATPKTGEARFWGGTVLWTTPKDLSDLETPYLENPPRTITEDGLRSCAANVLPANSVLLSSRAPIGLVAINSKPMATNQGFKSFVPNRKRVDPQFLYFWLKSKTEYLQGLGNGATFKELSKAVIERIEIPLPPLDEQRRIAAILDKADMLRRKRKRALGLLDGLTQSIFLKMFGDDQASPYEIMSLDEVTEKITDGAHFTPTYVDTGVPFLRVTDIQDEKINWNRIKYIPEAEHRELILRCRPEIGDVLLSKNGTIGLSKYVDWNEEFSIFVSLCLIKPIRSKLSGIYLTSYLKTPPAQRQLRQNSKTGTVTNLHLVDIRKILIPLPPMREQCEWERTEAYLRLGAASHYRAFEESSALFSSLQHRAFGGQL